jgi:subtilisin family serine protease
MHHTGQAADKGGTPSLPLNGIFDSASIPTLTPRPLNDHSSNYGPCVDVWAPGNLIYSTWGLHSDPDNHLTKVGVTYSGNGLNGTQGWTFLSGTSMAAPHVAGAAAYLADQFGLTTPAQIEQKVRQYFQNSGYTDRTGAPINYVQLR